MTMTPQKWRPSLSMVVTAMLFFVLSLPIAGIWVFRFYDSQLVRETEKELIVQGAFIEAFAIEQLRGIPGVQNSLSKKLTERPPQTENTERYATVPSLDLTSTQVLPPRPDPELAIKRAEPAMLRMGNSLQPLIEKAQETTLAGYRILDFQGIVIAGRSDVGLSLAHVDEVKNALNGNYTSVIRERVTDNPKPPLYAVSRGTNIRVFVAMPIVFQDRVAGVIYLSRTPSHFLRELYGQRWKIGLAALFMLLTTLAIAFVFIRTIKGPIEALDARTTLIAKGEREALVPLKRHGTREIASLSEGLLAMSKSLHDRSDYINTFANHVSHELKSPITSIHGAAELIRDSADKMNNQEREKFLDNIMADTARLTKLLERLRDLAKADNSDLSGDCTLYEVVEALRSEYSGIDINNNCSRDFKLAIPEESGKIVFGNLIENAVHHSATSIDVRASQVDGRVVVEVQDNGNGVSELNQEKIFELFFTTRRLSGGTGMGLGIVKSILSAHGGAIRYKPSESKGACFELIIPSA